MKSSYDTFWQSPLWGRILLRSHHAQEIILCSQDGAITSFSGENLRKEDSSQFLIEIRYLSFGQKGAFILGTKQVPTQTSIDSLRVFLRDRGCIFLQIEPLEGEIPFGSVSQYRSFLTPYTRVLDITGTPDQILESMETKGRYNIRLAERKGVVVERVHPNSENIDTFFRILTETTLRDRFHQNSRAYYEVFLDELEKEESGGLYFASLDGRVIATSILVVTPERAIYYYGASVSDPEARKVKAPEALQWKMIEDARAYGVGLYDLLGIADPGDPSDPLMGVSQFKEKFGGMVVKLPEKKILPLSWKYILFMMLYKMRKGLKRWI